MSELQAGDVIDGKYRIIRLLGEGGMGAVYMGENIKIHRKVAIKTLLSAVAGSSDVVGRFEREATAAGRIGNSHILEVLDLGEMADGDRYMVMELLDGEPLSSRIESRGRLSASETAPLAIQVLEGLSAAHTAGIIHRDLKPDNIFLLRDHVGIKDYVKIIDFGISKFQTLSGDGEAMSMTRTGAVMGTPYYMSPEQASGSRETDARTDLYAIGVILYQAVTGRVPFDAPTFNQLLFKIVLSDPPPIKEVAPDLDDGFASIISKAMARDINARFQNAEEFKAAIEAWRASGAAVSIPPPPDRASMEASALGIPKDDTKPGPKPNAGTAGSWSTSQAGTPTPPNRMPVYAGLGLAVVLLVGGGIAASHAFSGGAPAASAANSASPAPVVAAAPAPPHVEPTAAPAPVPATPSVAPAVATATPAVEAKPKEPEAKTATTSARPAKGHASGTATPAKPEGPAKPAPARKAAEDDFGY